jgi:hypothetical protein
VTRFDFDRVGAATRDVYDALMAADARPRQEAGA